MAPRNLAILRLQENRLERWNLFADDTKHKLIDINIPISFLQSVAQIKPDEFSSVVSRYGKQIVDWHSNPKNIDSLRFASDKIVEYVEHVYGLEKPKAAWTRIAPALKFLSDNAITGGAIGATIAYIYHDLNNATSGMVLEDAVVGAVGGAVSHLLQKAVQQWIDPKVSAKHAITLAIVQRGEFPCKMIEYISTVPIWTIPGQHA